MILKKNKYSNRIAALDLLKLFAIFLVLYGHCMQHLLHIETIHNPMFLWIYTFHMPLFMTLSGLFSHKLYKLSFKEFIFKRSRQILLPTISWTIIIIGILILEDTTSISIKSIMINSLWFLKSLFICCILGYIAFKPSKHRIKCIIFSIILSQVCLIWNVYVMYPCFLFGILIHKYITELIKYKRLIIFVCGGLFFVLSIYISFTPEMWILNKGIRLTIFSGELSIWEKVQLLTIVMIKKYILLFIGIIGSIFFIAFFITFFNDVHNKFLKKLTFQGQYTLAVYVIQTVILETILPNWISFDGSSFRLFNWVIAPIISLIILWICLYLNKLILKLGGIIATLLLGVPFKINNTIN